MNGTILVIASGNIYVKKQCNVCTYVQEAILITVNNIMISKISICSKIIRVHNHTIYSYCDDKECIYVHASLHTPHKICIPLYLHKIYCYLHSGLALISPRLFRVLQAILFTLTNYNIITSNRRLLYTIH